MEKKAKQKTIYNIYNIETKETKEVSNWREWATSEGIPTNSLTLFKRMVGDPQRTFYKKYILKDEFFEERFPADIDISKGKIDHELFFIDSKGINFKFETELVSGLFRFPVLDP